MMREQISPLQILHIILSAHTSDPCPPEAASAPPQPQVLPAPAGPAALTARPKRRRAAAAAMAAPGQGFRVAWRALMGQARVSRTGAP